MVVLSIVVPCYNEEESVTMFLDDIQKTLVAFDYEVLFINDGSSDSTLEIIRNLADSNPNVKYISFSRNFGKESAIYAGLINATGNLVCVMDADLQHPPNLLPEMIEAISEGYDVAAAKRVSKKGEPPVNKLGSHLFYKLFNAVSSLNLVEGATDFRVMTRQVSDAVLELSEYNRFSKGIFQWVGFETKWIEYENVKRVAGDSTWSIWQLFKYSIEAIVAFTTVPLSISIFLGAIISVLAFIYLAFIVVKYLLYSDPVQGFATIMCTILLLGGIQLLSIGILGKYLEKTYKETKNRPIFIVKETNINDE
ncbi:MAG: glycosyltransferase family 2 protein [Methanobrevibacter sp.]|uniref:glycosyltransferase family 2 protein n=1 Tax=Methanobrevibacter sp. UBA212 TaxID=1915476 RepID=UPI0025E60EC4|nr:glycosyltransferase family 2 protein [Methanobrevibacter sp. UBA212]MBR3156732.1 glycosyltransferase family 2 protein [Methanobrevibacter sp.]